MIGVDGEFAIIALEFNFLFNFSFF